jgi:methyl-accepting chemotaxis protein
MSFIRNINLSVKFTLFGAIVSILLLLATLVSYHGMSGTTKRFDRFMDKYQALALLCSEMHTQGIQAEQACRNVILSPADEKALSNYKAASEKILELQKEAVAIAKGVDDYEKQLQNIPSLWQDNSVVKDEIIKLAMAGMQTEAVEILVKKETPKWREIKTQIITLQDALKKRTALEHNELNSFVSRTFYQTVATLGFVILLVIVLLIVFWKIMQASFNETILCLNTLASGDLTAKFITASRDEFGQLTSATRVVIENMHRIISQISNTSTQVAAASTQLQATAEHIATGAEEVAAQASTVATAGEEMSATSGDIAQNCQMAAEGAQRASQAASDGGLVVGRTVAVMGQIAQKVQESARTVESLGARSDQIGAIIGTIEDIADQTNLLALNAAIEAARAGEQGRGFAVVADEVRALAERTTRATKEIGEMIKAIQRETKGAVTAMEQGVRQVETGTEEAAKSGQALQDILQQVNDVAMQVNQIATAAKEQTATTSEISSNMMQITEVVQQTSQGAHESATAAAQLSGIAEELQRLVRQFKL